MTHRFITFLFLIFGWGLYAQPVEKPLAREKKKYEYLLYLPEDYAAKQKKFPLVIYLHGSSQKGNDLNKLKAYGIPQLVDQGRNFECIIASPQCPSEAALWSSENWFDTLFEELTTRYRIDMDRVYLTGISMGGGGTFEVAKQYPDKFAALLPLCAWQSSADDVCKLKNIPIWTFHGKDDPIVPIEQTEEKVKNLKNCNGNIRFTTLENEGHGIQWLYGDLDKYRIFDWMLSQKKK